MDAMANNNINVGVHVAVHFNQEKNVIEVVLSNQIKRHLIGAIDCVVTQIVGDAPLRRKFCAKSEGEFLGGETIQIPLYGLWTANDKKKEQQYNRSAPRQQRTSPISIGENAKITKVN